MVEDGDTDFSVANQSSEECLLCTHSLIPISIAKAKEVKGFTSRWKLIISKIEQIPLRLSDLSTHPLFSKNMLCIEQMQAISSTLNEAIRLTEVCLMENYKGKLQMQSDLDAILCRLDLNLKDLDLLIKTRVLSESNAITGNTINSDADSTDTHMDVRELLMRLQIGHLEAKHKVLDTLVDVMKDDEETVLTLLSRTDISSLVNLLTASSPKIRDKTVTIICSLAESNTCDSWLVSEGVILPLIRLVESSSPIGREKAIITLQRMSMMSRMTSADTCRSIASHNGIRLLIEACCCSGDRIVQSSAACALKNLSGLQELQRTLADEGIVNLMVNLLNNGVSSKCKEYAAECLQNLTLSNDVLCRIVVSENGIQTLLNYLDSPFPQEPAMGAVKNLIRSVPANLLAELGLPARLVHVLQHGSLAAQRAAALAVCEICGQIEVKKFVWLVGCVPLLVNMLELVGGANDEAAAQALANLMACKDIRREVKKEYKSVPNLVRLLDPNLKNIAKKYSVMCLLLISSSKKCKKVMVSYGAIGYLKKLIEMDVPGSKQLVERLDRGKITSLFGK